MKRKQRVFSFKQFDVCHERSALKVGVDGVLIAIWTCYNDGFSPVSVLDVGCGCGLISLICAQRFPNATIDAIDIDIPSVVEANDNFRASPWGDRLRAVSADYIDFANARNKADSFRGYDLIISNPPFFDSGVTPATAREVARHGDSLSPLSLIAVGSRLLSDSGRISLIAPADQEDKIITEASAYGLKSLRITRVRGNEVAPFKRVLMEFRRADDAGIACVADTLTLEKSPGVPTKEYLVIGRDFYLKW